MFSLNAYLPAGRQATYYSLLTTYHIIINPQILANLLKISYNY